MANPSALRAFIAESHPHLDSETRSALVTAFVGFCGRLEAVEPDVARFREWLAGSADGLN